MKLYFTFFSLFLISFFVLGQEMVYNREQFPVFETCKGKKDKALEDCFYYEVQNTVFSNYKVPEENKNDFRGKVIVLFEVSVEGKFNALYVDAENAALKEEASRVFGLFPKINPATYMGKPIFSKYTIEIAIPLESPNLKSEITKREEPKKTSLTKEKFEKNSTFDKNKILTEYDSLVYLKFNNPQFKSQLNIPFSHSYYAQFDAAMNQVGANNHTASKPYTYAEVNKYYSLEEANQKIMKSKTSWFGRKLWNENTVAIQGEGYWFTLNPILDLRVGKSDPSVSSYTYQNTRGVQIQGGLGKQLSFTTSIYESQGRFADYFNRYAESIAPSGSNPAIIPGVGIAKEFKTDAYDFPLAEANLTYTPSDFINIQLGYGRNFQGDGYRSLIMADGASPYPYIKINTNFWKIKYTNTYMWLKDVREDVTVDRTYATKFMANHYLSWNVSKRLNVGFFESVIWSNTNDRGFDFNFVNPIIFYRAVEFSSSSRSGNAVLGITSKYKVNNQINIYGQFLIDEFSFGDVKAGNKSWKNKFGYQIGAKYYNALGIENLLLQAEYNHVRPYVYQHTEVLTNYGHNNQSMGHQWGANFRELVTIARYFKGRWFADAKLTFGVKGFDFDTADNNLNYGGNLYKDYEINRPFDTGVTVGQGNKTSIFIADVQAGYLINPSTNFKLFASLIYRDFKPQVNTSSIFKETTSWVSVGVRADLFNWYFDY